jgi:hypothetical protein
MALVGFFALYYCFFRGDDPDWEALRPSDGVQFSASEQGLGEADPAKQSQGLGATLSEFPARSFAAGVLLPTAIAFCYGIGATVLAVAVGAGIALANGNKPDLGTIWAPVLFGGLGCGLFFATVAFFVYLRTSRLGLRIHERGFTFSDGTTLRHQDIARLELKKRSEVAEDLFLHTTWGRTITVSNTVVPPMVLEDLFNSLAGKVNA